MLHRLFQFFCGLFVFSLSTSLLGTDWQPDKSARPMRASFLKLSPPTDEEKALAPADWSGWVEASGMLIGAVDDEWVGGYAIKDFKPKWWVKIQGGLTVPPAIFGSWVVLCQRNGEILKLDVITGKSIWSQPVTLDSFVIKPLRKNSTSLFAVTSSQTLFAIDFASGATQWIYDPLIQAQDLIIQTLSAPALHNNLVYYGLSNGELVAVDVERGKLEWRFNPQFTDSRFRDVVGELVLSENKLILSRYDGLVTALNPTNPQDASSVWQNKPKLLPSIATSAFRSGRFFVGTVNGYIYAFNAMNGQEMWKTLIGPSVTRITTGEKAIFIASSEGRIFSLDMNDGSTLWSDDLGAGVYSFPFIVGDLLYFSTGYRNLYGYRL